MALTVRSSRACSKHGSSTSFSSLVYVDDLGKFAKLESRKSCRSQSARLGSADADTLWKSTRFVKYITCNGNSL